MTTTAGNGPFPLGTHTYSFISSPSTLMLSQNNAMVQPSSSDHHVYLGNITVYFFPRDRSASMGRATVGVNRNVAHDQHLITPGGYFTPRRFSGKIPRLQPIRTRATNQRIHPPSRPYQEGIPCQGIMSGLCGWRWMMRREGRPRAMWP